MIGERLAVRRGRVSVRTERRLQLVDVTRHVEDLVGRAGISDGLVSVQTLHTTTGILVNENEPLLLSDLEEIFDRWIPRDKTFHHDDLARRVGDLPPDEPKNGHAHARATLLRVSETIHLAEGRLVLGRWQRVFLVELDGPRDRSMSIVAMGV